MEICFDVTETVNGSNLHFDRREFEDYTQHKAFDTAENIDRNFDQCLEVSNDHSGIPLFEAERRINYLTSDKTWR
jgi:hypothetical protein